jgi:hypothetical protein
MPGAFQANAFQQNAFQVDQEVTVSAPIDIEIDVQRARPVAINAPLVGLEKRFIVVGRAYDLMGRRIRLVLEQLIDQSAISIPGTIIVEGYELELSEPTSLVILETYEPQLQSPTNLALSETYEMDIETPATEVIFEPWESA